MEDAMIINKSAYERGFGHGTVYKSQMIDIQSKNTSSKRYFSNIRPTSNNNNNNNNNNSNNNNKNPSNNNSNNNNTDSPYEKVFKGLDYDGLPIVGTKLTKGSILY